MIRVVGFIICSLFFSGVFAEEGKDNKPAVEKVNYSESDIIRLIDSVLKLNNPPKWVIEDLQSLIERKHKEIQEEEKSEESVSIPGEEYYNEWSTEKLYPYPDSLWKKDTSVYLTLSADYFSMPFSGKITSPYGWRDKRMHKGIDINLNKGNPVACAFDGMVRIARREGAYGNVVIVRHYNGLETTYAHLSKIKVKPGQIIRAGEVLGLGGSTGRSTGAHLHFEMRFKGVAINPEYFISFQDNILLAEDFVLKKTSKGFTAYPKNSKLYVVKRGDSLSKVAQRYGLNVQQLKKLNSLTGKTCLKAGQTIRVA